MDYWKMAQQIECLHRCVDGTWSAIRKTVRVVGVRMREYNGRRRDGTKPGSPVSSTIDHYPSSAMPDEKRAMPPMTA
jgi:hypothetical protein